MAFTLKMDPKTNYLHAMMEGEYEFAAAIHCIDLILDACEENKIFRVLLDIREVKGHIQPIDRFHFAESFSVKYFERVKKRSISHCRFSMVGKEPVLDPHRFGETVAINRGLTVNASTDLREALDWLMVE